jgi:hypothetical protein
MVIIAISLFYTFQHIKDGYYMQMFTLTNRGVHSVNEITQATATSTARQTSFALKELRETYTKAIYYNHPEVYKAAKAEQATLLYPRKYHDGTIVKIFEDLSYYLYRQTDMVVRHGLDLAQFHDKVYELRHEKKPKYDYEISMAYTDFFPNRLTKDDPVYLTQALNHQDHQPKILEGLNRYISYFIKNGFLERNGTVTISPTLLTDLLGEKLANIAMSEPNRYKLKVQADGLNYKDLPNAVRVKAFMPNTTYHLKKEKVADGEYINMYAGAQLSYLVTDRKLARCKSFECDLPGCVPCCPYNSCGLPDCPPCKEHPLPGDIGYIRPQTLSLSALNYSVPPHSEHQIGFNNATGRLTIGNTESGNYLAIDGLSDQGVSSGSLIVTIGHDSNIKEDTSLTKQKVTLLTDDQYNEGKPSASFSSDPSNENNLGMLAKGIIDPAELSVLKTKYEITKEENVEVLPRSAKRYGVTRSSLKFNGIDLPAGTVVVATARDQEHLHDFTYYRFYDQDGSFITSVPAEKLTKAKLNGKSIKQTMSFPGLAAKNQKKETVYQQFSLKDIFPDQKPLQALNSFNKIAADLQAEYYTRQTKKKKQDWIAKNKRQNTQNNHDYTEIARMLAKIDELTEPFCPDYQIGERTAYLAGHREAHVKLHAARPQVLRSLEPLAIVDGYLPLYAIRETGNYSIDASARLYSKYMPSALHAKYSLMQATTQYDNRIRALKDSLIKLKPKINKDLILIKAQLKAEQAKKPKNRDEFLIQSLKNRIKNTQDTIKAAKSVVEKDILESIEARKPYRRAFRDIDAAIKDFNTHLKAGKNFTNSMPEFKQVLEGAYQLQCQP